LLKTCFPHINISKYLYTIVIIIYSNLKYLKMSYIIEGPTIIGTTGQSTLIRGPVGVGDITQNTTINGPIFTPTLTTGTGDVIYCSNGGTGALTRLGVGSNGQVLTLASGLPSWVTPSGGGTTNLSFSAFKSGTQAITVAASTTTTTQITGWSTTSPGFDGTGGQFASNAFTPTITGTYLFSINLSFTDTSNSGSRTILIRNTTSATTLASRQYQPTPDTVINQQTSINIPLALTASNVIQLQLTVSTGATGTTSTIQAANGSSWWSVIRLS
jgi:hypothetical protein